MTVLAIWLRRGLGLPTAVVVFAFLMTSLFSQRTWMVELDWATRLTAASTLMVCVCTAAITAYETAARFRPTLVQLSAASVRSRFQIALPAVGVVIWAILAYIAAWAIAAALVAGHGGVGVTDWWVFAEVIVPIVAAGMVGLLAGMTMGGRSAAPIAAMFIIATLVITAPWGRGPFDAVSTYGTLTGIQRVPIRALVVVLTTALLAMVVLLCATEFNRSTAPRRLLLGAWAAVLTLTVIVPRAWPWRTEVYQFTTERYGCIGTAPSVCGPQSRLPILKPVQTSLAQAYRTLAGTDFTKPSSFRITRMDHYSDLDGAAPLDFDPADVRDGRYSQPSLVNVLLRPHQCLDLFNAARAVPILEAEDKVAPWLAAVLNHQTPALPVPQAVEDNFKVVEDCTPMTTNRES